MPTEFEGGWQVAWYGYLCSACRNEFRLARPIGEGDSSAECPRCGAKAKRATSTSGQTTSDEMRSQTDFLGDDSDSASPAVAGEETRLGRSTTGSATRTTAIPDESMSVDSEVDFRQADPIDLSWLNEYEPRGSNLVSIHDWGIASVLGYLRDRSEVRSDEGVAAKPQVDSACPRPAADEKKVVDAADLRPRRRSATESLMCGDRPSTPSADGQAVDAARCSCLTEDKMVMDFPDEMVKAAWRRQGGRCAKCGRWLVWSQRGKRRGSGAWQSHRMAPPDRGGKTTLANCVVLCSGVADCHFKVGHGGIAWTHYAPLDDSVLLYLFDSTATVEAPPPPTRPKRSLLREVFGIPRSKKGQAPGAG
jgi:putative FmdB family regulatory protein